MNASTVQKLRDIHCSAMAEELEAQMRNPGIYASMGFEDRLARIVDAESDRRRKAKLQRYIKSADFDLSTACIEDIEYLPERKLDKAQILRFASCEFIDAGHNIVLKGASGSGKSYIAQAIGNAACRKYKKVKYIRMPALLDELATAKATGEFRDTIKSYQKLDLLIIDEWLIRCLEKQESYDLLEIVDARSNAESGGSMILCTQYNDDEWYERIDPEAAEGSPISEAVMDRIINNSEEVMIESRTSMRKRHGIAGRSGKGGAHE